MRATSVVSVVVCNYTKLFKSSSYFINRYKYINIVSKYKNSPTSFGIQMGH